MNNFGTNGWNPERFFKKVIHSEVMQLVAQLVLAVERLPRSWGTGPSGGCSHYEEDDLIGSKRKKSSEEGSDFTRILQRKRSYKSNETYRTYRRNAR